MTLAMFMYETGYGVHDIKHYVLRNPDMYVGS